MVHNGQIVEGQLSETGTEAASSSSSSSSTPAPAATPTPGSGYVTDPHGGYYARGEYCPDADAGLTTVDADGNVLTCVLESGRYHWH